MNCYEHPETVAVASCQDCTRGLCQDCSNVFNSIICLKCNANHFLDDKSSIKTFWWASGILFTVGCAVSIRFSLNLAPKNTFFEGISHSYYLPFLFGGFPWGWKIIDQPDYQPANNINITLSTPLGIFFGTLIKIAIAAVVGGIALPFSLFQSIKRYKVIEDELWKIESYLKPGLARVDKTTASKSLVIEGHSHS